jgi:hypothetical protein
MTKISHEEEQKRKKAIFESMSPRRQQHILTKGYEKWDPFQEPKDPIDIRKDKTKRTTQELFRAFLQSRDAEEYSNAYGSGVFEMCHGIINDDDKYIGMLEFSVWYQELLKQEGHE